MTDPYKIDDDNQPLTDEQIKGLSPGGIVLAELGIELNQYKDAAETEARALDKTLKRLSEANSKLAQAYQILGALLIGDDPETYSEEESIKILDYFADEDAYDDDFLPVGEIEQRAGELRKMIDEKHPDMELVASEDVDWDAMDEEAK